MSEPFIAEIRIFAGNFAPRGWAFCQGQLLPIAQNTALFSLIGTTYGGDGRTTTALPDLQGRAAMHPGRGPGLTARRLGEKIGVETVTLNDTQIPSHTHSITGGVSIGVNTSAATTNEASGNVLGQGSNIYNNSAVEAGESLGGVSQNFATQNVGGNLAHNNMQPFLTLSFIIALVGLYPSRS